MTDQAWEKFAKDGWKHDEVPSKRDCFEAGWKAAIKYFESKIVWQVDESGIPKKIHCENCKDEE